MTIESPTFTCEASLLPSFSSISKPFKQMAGIPGQIKSAAIEYGTNTPEYKQAMALAKQVQTVIDTIGDLIDAGLTSVSSPMFSNTKSNDQSWDLRVKALLQEFSIYVPKMLITMIVEALGFANPLLLPIPIPGLSDHNIEDLFTIEGRAAIKKTIAENLEPITSVLSSVKTAFSKDTQSTEFKVMEVFQAAVGSVQKFLVEQLIGLFDLVVGQLEDLGHEVPGWAEIKALIPVGDAIDSLLDAIVEEAYSTKEAFITALLDIEIPGTGITLGVLMNMTYRGEKESSETFSIEKLKNQIIQSAHTYFILYPMKLLQDWIGTVKTILENLLPFPFPIPFTFCDCLNIIFIPVGGFPPALPV